MLDRTAHIDESLAEVLAAVSGYQHHAAAVRETCRVVTRLPQDIAQIGIERLVRLDLVDHHVQRVDDRIASNDDLLVGNAFGREVGAAQRRGREVVGRYAPRYLTVHLLGPRTVNVMGAQSRLDMSHWYLLVECRQRRGRRGGRIAVHEHDVGAGAAQYIAHAQQHARGHVVEVLPLLHDIQIVIGLYVEYAQHLIQHLTMLTGNAYDAAEAIRMFGQLLDQRSHFDSLRTRSEDRHDRFHIFTTC